MGTILKCSFCNETKHATKWPQQEGFTQIEIHAPNGNRYLVNCGCAKPADVATAVKDCLSKK